MGDLLHSEERCFLGTRCELSEPVDPGVHPREGAAIQVRGPTPETVHVQRQPCRLGLSEIVYLVLSIFFAWELVVVPVSTGLSIIPAAERLVGPLCHHDPERTPSLFGTRLGVCARCSGIWVGWLSTAILVRGQTGSRPAGRRRCTFFSAVLAGAVLGLIAALAESSGWIESSNSMRFVMGWPLGVSAGLFLVRNSTMSMEVRS